VRERERKREDFLYLYIRGRDHASVFSPKAICAEESSAPVFLSLFLYRCKSRMKQDCQIILCLLGGGLTFPTDSTENRSATQINNFRSRSAFIWQPLDQSFADYPPAPLPPTEKIKFVHFREAVVLPSVCESRLPHPIATFTDKQT
jgi:hypothetical protein